MENKNKEEKKESFVATKNLSKEQIALLPKVMVKLEKKISSNKKNVNFLAKFKMVFKNGKSMVIQNYISEVVAELILYSWGKSFDNKGIAYNLCPIRYSKGSKEGKEYKAYDLILTSKRRLFNFFSEDEIEYMETFGASDIEFEDRVYFDEDGYEFKPDNF